MIHVRLAATVVKWSAMELISEFKAGRVPPEAEASFDRGRTWRNAVETAKWLEEKRAAGNGIHFVLPENTERRSVIASYVAFASFLFFAGPLYVVALIVAWAARPAVGLVALAIAFLLGPVPIAAVGAWALSAHRADPTKRGIRRAYYAIVVAAALTFGLLTAVTQIIAKAF